MLSILMALTLAQPVPFPFEQPVYARIHDRYGDQLLVTDGGRALVTCDNCSSAGSGAASLVTGDGGYMSAYGHATTAAPSYTNNTDDPLSLDLGGGLRINIAGQGLAAVTVQGTVTTSPPSNASTNVAQWGGTNTTLGQKVSASSVPVVLSSDFTPTIQGTVSTNPPSNASTNVTQWNGNTVNLGSGTGGTGTLRVITDTASVIQCNAGTNLNTSALATSANQTTLGNQTTKVNDGTNTAAVKAASTAAAATDPALVVSVSPNTTVNTQDVDNTTSGAIGSLNAAVTSTQLGIEGYASIGFPATNTLVGTLNVDCTADKGTTWSSGTGWFITPNGTGALATLVAASTPTSTNYGLLCARGSNGIRVRVNPYTSGTVTPTLATNFSPGLDYTNVTNLGSGSLFVTPMGGWAIDTANTKEAYLRTTNAQTTDPALVVALSPNSVANGAAIAGGRGTPASDVIRMVPVEPTTYSCGTAAKTAVANSTLPFTTLCGSATKTVRVQKIRVSTTTATAAVYADLIVRRYSAAPTGGTSTAFTKVQHDTNDAAATATGCLIYTATPTDGTSVGVIDGTMTFSPITGTVAAFTQPQTLEYFARSDSEAIVLRGTAQCAVVSFGTAPGNAPTAHVQWTWTEE